MKKVNSVVIVGGTHGNEVTGVYTVKHWREKNLVANYPQLNIELILANEAAIKENKRYLEKDLNRCFKLAELEDMTQVNKEQKLAKQINQLLGPKGNAKVDCIIDLHTSTANMKTNIVLIKNDDFHLKLAAYLKSVLTDLVITTESELMQEHHFLCSIADKSILIEVGPTPQGSLDPVCFDKTQRAINASLKFIELYNQQALPELDDELELMVYFSKLYFPINPEGEINATVHPDLIGKDYSTIQKGCAIFRTFDGEDILYQGETAVVAFVNEAAYYDQKIAMCLCKPVRYSLTSCLPVK